MGADTRTLSSFLLMFCAASAPLLPAAPDDVRKVSRYKPLLREPPTLAPLLQHVEPGRDGFPEEKDAAELAVRLAELSRGLRQGPGHAARCAGRPPLPPDFTGGDLTPEEVPAGGSPGLEVFRSAGGGSADAPARRHDPAAFRGELAALLAPFRALDVAEFLVTAIDVEPGRARTVVRYDLVGTGAPGVARAGRGPLADGLAA